MPKKKKTKVVILPWCWYCEREFEDEKVLMQHQKAKHYKCRHCPRKLNTAGGLAVHVQQVHKLDPDKIDNALPGRDGGEVEIFGMEGIPKDDLDAWRRKKEQEAGVAAGSSSQPPQKRPKLDKRPISEAELAQQLAAHKLLMSGGDLAKPFGASGAISSGAPTVYGAPQTYAAPPMAGGPGMPPPGAPGFPGGPPPFFAMPPPGALPPGGPNPPFPPFPPGMGPPPGFAPGMPPFPPGLGPPGPNGMPPFPMGPNGVPVLPPGAAFPPGMGPPPAAALAGPTPGSTTPALPQYQTPIPPAPSPADAQLPPAATAMSDEKNVIPLPDVSTVLSNKVKDGTTLAWDDPNYTPEERRSQQAKYAFENASLPVEPDSENAAAAASSGAEPRGTKRARAEDFL